jgi:hypothetical protein
MLAFMNRWFARCLAALRLIGECHPGAVAFGGLPAPRSRASERR